MMGCLLAKIWIMEVASLNVWAGAGRFGESVCEG